jgi:hypothetical protein
MFNPRRLGYYLKPVSTPRISGTQPAGGAGRGSLSTNRRKAGIYDTLTSAQIDDLNEYLHMRSMYFHDHKFASLDLIKNTANLLLKYEDIIVTMEDGANWINEIKNSIKKFNHIKTILLRYTKEAPPGDLYRDKLYIKFDNNVYIVDNKLDFRAFIFIIETASIYYTKIYIFLINEFIPKLNEHNNMIITDLRNKIYGRNGEIIRISKALRNATLNMIERNRRTVRNRNSNTRNRTLRNNSK